MIEEKRKAGAVLLDLTVSNPTRVFDNYPNSEIRGAYASIKDFAYRPDPFGDVDARLHLARYYDRRGVSISPEQIALTASTSEAYSLLFKLFCNPGDNVLVPVPSYPLFEFLASLESVEIVRYRLLYDGNWFIDLANIREQITPRTRALVIINPHNPTGSFLKKSEMETLFEIATEYKLPIISDEVFTDFSFAADPGRVSTLMGCDPTLSFSMSGLSKAAGMPQMKLSWIVLNGPQREREAARNRLELVFDTYLSVGTPVQRALPDLLSIGEGIQEAIRRRTVNNLNALDAELAASPVHRLHCEAGWSAILKLPATLSEEDWITRLILDQNVIVQPGYFFDMSSEAYVVVSLLTPEDEFAEGIRSLRHLAATVEI